MTLLPSQFSRQNVEDAGPIARLTFSFYNNIFSAKKYYYNVIMIEREDDVMMKSSIGHEQ